MIRVPWADTPGAAGDPVSAAGTLSTARLNDYVSKMTRAAHKQIKKIKRSIDRAYKRRVS
jgi:hypothetical protein